MEEKLLKLIYDYSKQKKLVDEEFIHQFVEIVISNRGLHEYCSNVDFVQKIICENPKEINVSAIEYSPSTKNLKIYLDRLQLLLEKNNKYDSLFNWEELLFYRNIVIVQMLLYKLECVNECKTISVGSGIEANLLKLSYKCENGLSNNDEFSKDMMRSGFTEIQIKMHIQEIRQKYEQSYEALPKERIAQIKSYQELLNIIQPIYYTIPNIFLLEEINESVYRLKGYTDDNGTIISPTVSFLTLAGFRNELRQFPWYDDNSYSCLKKCLKMYHLSERTLYGLPIGEEEYNNMKNDIQYKLEKLR